MRRKLHRIYQNLLNGNLRDAQEDARHVSDKALTDYAKEDLAWELQTAKAAVNYLKKRVPFQAYCDAAAK